VEITPAARYYVQLFTLVTMVMHQCTLWFTVVNNTSFITYSSTIIDLVLSPFYIDSANAKIVRQINLWTNAQCDVTQCPIEQQLNK